MKHLWPTLSMARRTATGDSVPVSPEPREVALKLTNRCNLRCTHCYQWSETGHHRDLSPEEQAQDLDFVTVERVFAATRSSKSSIYLWGGEPMVYRDWDRLTALLQRDRRWTTVCTNGLLVERRLDSVLPISDQLEMYFAVDGPPQAHDALRGRGTHERTMTAIDRLASERAAGRYLGEISINCVLSPAALDGMEAFVANCERRGVDTFYLALPWHLSAATCEEMDAYCATHAPFGATDTGRSSWRAYTYAFDRADTARLMDTIEALEARPWKLALRYNPRVGRDEIDMFVSGGSQPAQNRTRCLAIKSRMDVMPNGDIVSCKFFPESVMGNAREQPLDVWHGQKFEHLRQTVDRHGLMPVCAKCNLLYSRGQ